MSNPTTSLLLWFLVLVAESRQPFGGKIHFIRPTGNQIAGLLYLVLSRKTSEHRNYVPHVAPRYLHPQNGNGVRRIVLDENVVTVSLRRKRWIFSADARDLGKLDVRLFCASWKPLGLYKGCQDILS
jgi:hypothetical protein